MARSGRNAAFIATSDHYGALGTGCDRPGRSCPRALRLGCQRAPAPHRRDALPPARPPLANPSRSRGSNSNPAKLGAFPSPSAGTDVALHAVPTVPRARQAREAQDFRPPPQGSVPHERKPPPPPCSRILRRARDGRVGGGARRSRRPSRACRSHVSSGVTCSRRSQSQRTLSRSKEAVVRDRPRPEMFSSLAPAALGAVAASAETPAAAATRRPSIRG